MQADQTPLTSSAIYSTSTLTFFWQPSLPQSGLDSLHQHRCWPFQWRSWLSQPRRAPPPPVPLGLVPPAAGAAAAPPVVASHPAAAAIAAATLRQRAAAAPVPTKTAVGTWISPAVAQNMQHWTLQHNQGDKPSSSVAFSIIYQAVSRAKPASTALAELKKTESIISLFFADRGRWRPGASRHARRLPRSARV